MSLAKQNYNIYKKELLAIIETLKYQRNYLQGTIYLVIIYTDYINLRGFTTTKDLTNRRLARQAEELASYNIIIKHIKGTDNLRADALSRKPGYKDDKIYEKTAILRTLENGDLALAIREVTSLKKARLIVKGTWLDKLV